MCKDTILKPIVLSSVATLDCLYRCVTYYDRLKVAIAKSEIMPLTEPEFTDLKALYDEYLNESSLLMAHLSLQVRDPKSLPHMRVKKLKDKHTVYVKSLDSVTHRTLTLSF